MTFPRGIIIVSPGGLSRGGGIGSITRAMHLWLGANAAHIPVFVLDPRGTRADRASLPAFLGVIVQLLWLRMTRHADILHLQVSEGGSFVRKGILLVLGRLLGMRTILHHHGARLAPFLDACGRPALTFVRATAVLADCNIVLGEASRRLLITRLTIPPERIIVLRNTAPDPDYQPPPNPAPAHFLVPAALSARKGTTDFLSAFALLGPAVTATLAGEGDIAFYRDLCSQLGIADRVHFTGWLDAPAVTALHRTGTALVLASHDEGMPVAIVEALASGLPVIATPVGAIPEVLADGETALLVAPGAPQALAAAMVRLTSDRTLANRLSHNGRAVYERLFTLEPAMSRLLALYGSLLDAQMPWSNEIEGGNEVGENGGAAAQ